MGGLLLTAPPFYFNCRKNTSQQCCSCPCCLLMTQFRLNFSIRVSASVSHPLKQWALDRIINNPASQTHFFFFAFVTATNLPSLELLAVAAVTIQDCSCSRHLRQARIAKATPNLPKRIALCLSLKIEPPTEAATSQISRPTIVTTTQRTRPCLPRKRTSATRVRRTGSSRAAFFDRSLPLRLRLAASTPPSTLRMCFETPN